MKQTGRHPEQGPDVVYHEFAHKLDIFDGARRARLIGQQLPPSW